MRIFLKILQDGDSHFIAELHIQQVRKLVLEMIQRMPANDLLKPYAKNILSLTFKLLEYENEENVLVCLRIIIELHKQVQNNPQSNGGVYFGAGGGHTYILFWGLFSTPYLNEIYTPAI